MRDKPKFARAVHANRGLSARYRQRITALIDEMAASAEYWLTAAYRDFPPVLAEDASPSEKMRRSLADLAKRWQRRFNESAPKIAEAYLRGSFKATDSAMRSALRDAGWTVKFQMTPAIRDAFDASLAENVALIRSIPEQYLLDVQGAVSRSYTAGRDLKTMVADLKRIYPKAANRAILIARDQSNKANGVVARARQMELGITEAYWMHSHAGKTPRPTHVAMNGKVYKISEGMYDPAVKRFINPGELINCRCTSRPKLPLL